MNKVEQLTYMFTRQIKDRAQAGNFKKDEYEQLVRNIFDWCRKELHK